VEIFPIAYFGSIGYFQALAKAEKPIFDLHEHFVKQSLRSRCRILGANGIQQLSVPVIRPNGSKTALSEVQVSPDNRWRKEHWRSIESAYASSPYFEFYDKEIRSMIEFNTIFLSDLNIHMTVELFKLIGIHLKYEVTNAYRSDYPVDHRSEEDINSSCENPYIQVFGKQFEPNLSFLDILFCEGPLARNFILNQ
jgi:hypothetical protein